jgi:ubiquitin carboxyl-terminal hydrolase L3
MEGQTSVPANAEDEVDYHYVAFVPSKQNGHIYELDGDRKGPIDTGVLLNLEDDMLSESGLGVLKRFVREKGEFGFSLMALTSTTTDP